MKQLLLALFLVVYGFAAIAQAPKKHTIFFELDHSEISPQQKELLNSWLKSFSDTAKRLEIVGYADYLGTDSHNIILSQNRANTVLSLIEKHTILNYRMSLVSAKGEAFSKENGNSTNGNPDDRKVDVLIFSKTQEQDLNTESELLVRAEVGQTVILKNLNFFPGRHYLVPKALPELERFIEIMISNPTLEVEVQGHICCKLDSLDGWDINTATFELSFNRAKYIHDQLVLAGVEDYRIKFRGFAGSRPLIVPELTDKDRLKNRRVEIKILQK